MALAAFGWPQRFSAAIKRAFLRAALAAEDSNRLNDGLTMPLILTIIVFITVALVVFAFGAAAVTPSSVLGARLRALGGHSTMAQEKPAAKVRERIEQALDPLSKAIPLSPTDVSRTRAWLIQAGLPRVPPRQLLFRRPHHAGFRWPCRRHRFLRCR